MAESLINFTRPQFENLMETQGLEKTVEGVLSIASDRFIEKGIIQQPITIKRLGDGTDPILDILDRTKNLEPEKRQVGLEDALTLFTNVEDFGKYDPTEGTFPQTKAAAKGATRVVPETVGAFAGFKAGAAGGAQIASKIPAVGLPGLLIRGAVIGIGAIGGAITGAIAAGEAEDAIIGEADPVVPSLEPAYRMGESGTIALSMLATPWRFFTNTPKASTGALEFLDNFKKISTGKFKNIADEAFEVTAKNAGLSEKAFQSAMKARSKATVGPMFGGQGVNLGLTRFNPAGFLVDPRKGPLGARVLGGIETGIKKSQEFARQKFGRYLGLETAAAGGMGLGAYIAQDIKPYSESARFVGELGGTFIVPLPIQIAANFAPDVVNTMGRWYGNMKNREKLLKGKKEQKVVDRFINAIKLSEEYADELNEAGEVVVSADEKFAKFIDGVIKNSIDKDGNPVDLTTADLARVYDLPFATTVRTIQNELAKSSKDLEVATGRGREELQAGAINSIRMLAATGDPTALAVSARITQSLFEQNITDGIDESVSRLMVAGKQLAGRELDGGSVRANLSTKLYSVLENQINLSKERERKLWKAVGRFPMTEFFTKNNRQTNTPNTLLILNRSSARNGLKFSSKGAQTKFNRAISDYADDIKDFRDYFEKNIGRNPANSLRFYEMRSGLLETAAELRKQGKGNTAVFVDRLANAVLLDLTGQKNNVSKPYHLARAYTFARNNVFTRSFLNKLQTYDKDRGLTLDGNLLIDELFKGNNLAVVQRYNQIRAAGKFLADAGFSEEQINMMDSNAILSAALRDKLSDIMDKKSRPNPANPSETIDTFVVNETKLNTLKKQPGYKEFISLIPKLDKDLADVETAQKTFDNQLANIADIINPTQARQRNFSEKQITAMYGAKAFNWVLQFEDPGRSVAAALASERPTLALNALYKLASETDMAGSGYTKQQAISGFKSAIFNNALTKSERGTGLPNGDVLQREIFGQVKGSDPTVKFNIEDFLISKGLSTKKEMKEVQDAIKLMRGVEEAYNTGDFENVLFKKPSLAKLFYLRIAGATAGSAVQNKMKKLLGLPQLSGGLIAEQTGSEMVQRLLLQGPEQENIRILTKFLTEPDALGAMMKEIKDKKDLDKAMGALEKVFAPLARQTGRRFPLAIRATEEQVTEEYTLPDRESKPLTRQIAPVLPVETGPRPQLSPFTTETPPTNINMVSPSLNPIQGTQRVNRQRFADLFPEDAALIRGIGSLPR